MNRIANFFVSVAAAASLTVGAGVSASAECVYFSDVADFEVISLSRIESSTRYNCFPGYGGRFLISDRTVKKGNLHVGSDEIFTVSKGTTLTLEKGAHIDGTLYIQQGGKVVVRGGSLLNCGSILCDGDIIIGEKVGLSLLRGSMFLVNKCGSLELNCDEIYNNNAADILCLGELEYNEYLSEDDVNLLKANPIFAMVKGVDGNYKKVTSKNTMQKYLAGLQNYGQANGEYRAVVMMFDNGSAFKFTQNGDVTKYIGTIDPGALDGLATETVELAARDKGN